MPKKVLVLGVEYKLLLKEGLMEREGCEGITDLHEYTITIDKSLVFKPKAFEKVYWHEVAHAFAHESGLHEILDEGAREMFAQTFSVFMCSQKD